MKNIIFLTLSLFSSLLMSANLDNDLIREKGSSSGSSTEEINEDEELKLFYDIGAFSLKNKATRNPHENEDRCTARSIENAFKRPEQKAAAFCLFDGHGGSIVAEYLQKELINNFIFSLDEEENVEKAIKNAFSKADLLAREVNPKQGSTAVAAIICQKKIFWAHAGDSGAIIVQRKENKYFYQKTTDHKPTDPQEQVRILDAGGTVDFSTGIARVGNVLSLSRSIGDYPKELGLSAEPEIMSKPLDSTIKFLILFSDGVSDKMTPEDIIFTARNAFTDGKSANEAAMRIVNRASERGSRDDITALVVRFLWDTKKPENAMRLKSPLFEFSQPPKRKRVEEKKSLSKRVKTKHPNS